MQTCPDLHAKSCTSRQDFLQFLPSLAGNIYNRFALEGGGHDWKMIWLIPAGIAFVVMLGFALSFRNEKITNPDKI